MSELQAVNLEQVHIAGGVARTLTQLLDTYGCRPSKGDEEDDE